MEVFISKILDDQNLSPEKKDKTQTYRVQISPNPFHVSGGGQPGDSGHIENEDFKAQVTDSQKNHEGSFITIKLIKGVITEGKTAIATVDKERNHLLSRMHTGEHILSRIMERSQEGLHVYKVSIDEDQSSIFLRSQLPLTWEFLFNAEDKANLITAQNLPVNTRYLTPSEARALSSLKANWDRIEDDSIRIVEIPDFDLIACSGTHVTSTNEVGTIFIDSYKKYDDDWEIKFTVNGKNTSSNYDRQMRKLLHNLHCRPEELEKIIERLKTENREMAQTLNKVRPYVSLPFSEETAGNHKVYFLQTSGLNKELVMPSISTKSQEHPDSLILCLLDGEFEKAQFILLAGKNLALPLKTLLKDEKLSLKGGGTNETLNGITTCRSKSVWLSALSSLAPVNM